MGPMRVTMLYFAAARERAGVPSEALELAEGATAGQALALACERHPALQAVAAKLRLAVDQDFSPLDRKLREGAEVALIPPVSGGV
jgi:molybdopterin synthase catalytic subunit